MHHALLVNRVWFFSQAKLETGREKRRHSFEPTKILSPPALNTEDRTRRPSKATRQKTSSLNNWQGKPGVINHHGSVKANSRTFLRRTKSSNGEGVAKQSSTHVDRQTDARDQPDSSTSVTTTNSASSNYAMIIKNSSSARANTPVPEPHHSQANDNLAYLRDDDNTANSPPVPESIYARLPHHLPTYYASQVHPPPLAFSDSDSSKLPANRGEAVKSANCIKGFKSTNHSQTFRDYMDIDKVTGLNNNSADTLSFYSDNYVKANTLGRLGGDRSGADRSGADRSGHHLKPPSMSTSIYSSGSSGISVSSLEVSLSKHYY